MKKIVVIGIVVAIVAIAIFASFFIYNVLFGVYIPPSSKQPFFVNCSYYIYPNGTYVVVNITKVIQLGKVKPYLYNPEKPNEPRFVWTPDGTFIDRDHNGLLSEGDQFFTKKEKNDTHFLVELAYGGPDADGKQFFPWSVLWDSEHGPYVWKEE